MPTSRRAARRRPNPPFGALRYVAHGVTTLGGVVIVHAGYTALRGLSASRDSRRPGVDELDRMVSSAEASIGLNAAGAEVVVGAVVVLIGLFAAAWVEWARGDLIR